MYYLVHKDASVSEKERGMYGMLAYRLLSKAAEALPPDSVSKSEEGEDEIDRHRNNFSVQAKLLRHQRSSHC